MGIQFPTGCGDFDNAYASGYVTLVENAGECSMPNCKQPAAVKLADKDEPLCGGCGHLFVCA